MTIEAISALGGADASATTRIAPTGVGTSDFMQWAGSGLAQVGESLQLADAKLRALAAGRDVSVHEVMISLEQARMDLTFATEVRNRLVEAYQELTRMQL